MAATYNKDNKLNRQTCISSAGFESSNPVFNRLQTYALNFTVTRIHSNCTTSHLANQFLRQPCNSILINYSLRE